MKSLFQLFLGVVIGLSMTNQSIAGGSKRVEFAPLKNSIKVKEISVASENALAGNWASTVTCGKDGKDFKGTHAGNEITIEVAATGGDEDYKHTLIYNLSKSYKIEGKVDNEQLTETRGSNGTISIDLPELDDDVPYVQQTLFLITTDGRGQSTSTSINFSVSRPVMLSPSTDPKVKENDCFERLPAEESTVGVLSNGSTAPSSIQVSQGIQKVWTSTRGWQWGVFVSPLSFIPFLGNLVSLNMSYFTQVSKQVSETMTVAAGYTLNPGDFMQVYVQPTRYVSNYDATMVAPCGQKKKLPGAYLFQWWGFAYHVYPVNPYKQTKILKEAVGAPPVNTCPAGLSPLSDSNSSSTVSFTRTN